MTAWRSWKKRRRAGLTACASLGLHLGLLAALLATPGERGPGLSDAAYVPVVLVAMSAGAPQPAAEPEEPSAAAEPLAEAPPLDAPEAPVSDVAATAPVAALAADGGSCAMADGVVAALGEPDARAALDRIPAARRSVANALMLWDGEWVRAGAFADAAVSGPIRRAVVQAVRDAPPDCAHAPQAGPVFIVLPDDAGSLVLVLGSGAWRWADLGAASKPR